MRRCLDLASMAWPACQPNPMVGAIIVHEGKIISEGYTSEYGGPHAEVNAIRGVSDELLKESTLFVSLEPCAHHGKTPPCADLIIEKSIPRVIVGCRDSYSEVSGKGIDRLKSNGIDVVEGVLEKDSLKLNRRFFTFHNKKRPFVILKWAESADGFIDSDRSGGLAEKISGPLTDQMVHQWRSEEEAILVGGNTARNDDPSLTTRLVEGRDPKRFVWTSVELSKDLQLHALGYNGIQADDVQSVLNALYNEGVQSVIVEGGRKVLQQFIDDGAYDEVRRVLGPAILGRGVRAPDWNEQADSVEMKGEDRVEFFSRITDYPDDSR